MNESDQSSVNLCSQDKEMLGGDEQENDGGSLKLSFENPNYHLDPERLADALNSNNLDLEDLDLSALEADVESLYEELGGKSKSADGRSKTKRHGRGTYAHLQPSSMGVDVDLGPFQSDSHQENRCHSSSLSSSDMSSNEDADSGKDSPDGSDSEVDHNSIHELHGKLAKDTTDAPGIPHIPGKVNNDLYAVPVKRRSGEKSTFFADSSLPPGWERHEDENGPYYWHVKSGTIQRDLPSQESFESSSYRHSLANLEEALKAVTVPRSLTSDMLADIDSRDHKVDAAYNPIQLAISWDRRRSYPVRLEPEDGHNYSNNGEGKGKNLVRFSVRSLGWVEISEEDLTPERSSKAVNKCIVDLSLGRNDILDSVGKWGDGKDLYLDLDDTSLKLIDPDSLLVVNAQPIHTIRVWGVGRDNGRDFAYVARDKVTRKHMCHVFRCDTPARVIANTLRDICKRIMIERSLHHGLGRPSDHGGGLSGSVGPRRPNHLPVDRANSSSPSSKLLIMQSFPTPMEEPRKVLKSYYLGSEPVEKAVGMDMLNGAIDSLADAKPKDQWVPVSVAVAPSTITVTPIQDVGGKRDESVLCECRVRYLSFLGIGRDVRHCGFIMHTPDDKFIAHAFYCEPSSGALCKTIEAACKLRYQKCMDSHGPRPESNATTPGRSIGATIKSVIGSLTGRRTKSTES
ncbi:unnamed protein product [Darwinula stevensoni]|uniref:Uncharacterized protein n=1 Tax=Darwinula stevensoni TaxID=69355 RepID=A0A7R8X3Y1_9CRUS|nr:unnamed protein product [Darwinula stevensoni]CAG0879085.1 unnamed protein product [Darwinula stevensoni]